jgi:DNA-binding beta-propeller fold protein YncE
MIPGIAFFKIPRLKNIPWNGILANATFLQAKSVSPQAYAIGLAFSPDGSKMYTTDLITDNIYQWHLTTPWSVTSASLNQNKSLVTHAPNPMSPIFNPDGTLLFVISNQSDTIVQYALSTPWDISTISGVKIISVGSYDSSPQEIHLSPDGSKLFLVGAASNSVRAFSLSTPWDLNSISLVNSFSISSYETTSTGLFLNPDGTKLYVGGAISDKIHAFTLSVPWNITTSVFQESFSFAAQEGYLRGLVFDNQGNNMYIIGHNETVYQYQIT